MTAILCFAFAPFLLMLRNPVILNEEQVLLQAAGCVKYSNYTNESPDEENGPTVRTKLVAQQPIVGPSVAPVIPARHPPTHLSPHSSPLVH